MSKSTKLRWCPKCNERSVKVKVYKRFSGEVRRVEFCWNKGCGHRQDLPFPHQLMGVDR